ncbi:MULTISPECIES: glycosyltransferase family 2 protein [Sphingobacterium]|uniref:Glycosyltransferase family 2 protein n=1 Tax=Sphingobacterium populi TaxID=1812824 RepID=A0ABW5UBM6_9SPHI|nr:glycosyltransferase family 2 protein [Sphingobacterium sp. CFCC 11742]
MQEDAVAFSVIIPLYNKQTTIEITIQSVLDQHVRNFEIIIVNDGSTDESLQRVRSIQDHRIVIIDKQNEGVSKARNIGIQQSKYPWLCFLDADDYWESDHLTHLVEIIRKESHQNFLATGFRIATGDLKVSKSIIWPKRGLFNYFDVASMNGFAVHTSSVCIHKEILRADSFDENLSLGEDNELFSRIGRKYFVYFIPYATTYYISDSENKETLRNHPVKKDFLYNINLSGITNDKERKYYTLFIISHLLRFAIKEKNIAKSRTLYSYYRKDLDLRDFLYYFSRKIFR